MEIINKEKIIKYIQKKMKGVIKSYKVISIINILFEEIQLDLKSGKKIQINNFGTLELITWKPKRFWNYVTKKFEICKSRKNLKFSLERKLRDKLFENLDIDKTFPEPYDE